MIKNLLAVIALSCTTVTTSVWAGVTGGYDTFPKITPDYEIDGICYVLTEKGELAVSAKTTVEVIYVNTMTPPNAEALVIKESDLNYEGDVTVPAEVYINELDKILPVTSVMTGAFMGCPDLVSVSLPKSVTWMDMYALADNPKLKSLKLPDDLSTICVGMLQGCKELKSLEIPKSVSTVFPGAFYDCGVESLTFSDQIEIIYGEAFTKANALKSLTLGVDSPDGITIEMWGDQPLEIPAGCVLYVPEEGVEAFKSRKRWSSFADIRAIGTDAISEVEAAAANVEGPAYNLLGQPMAKPRPGDLIIRNRRKVIAE